MKQHFSWIVLAVVVSALVACGARAASSEEPARDVIFSDDFSNYKNGEEPSGNWSAFSGHWFVKDGVLNQDAGGFDYGIVAKSLYLRCDYRIEAKVRLVSGGAGAGLYWNVYDALTGENGHMLRFDGNRPIMYGWMHGRGFLGTGGATGDLFADGIWHTIRMDVNNGAGTFDVYWDGTLIADDALLYHRSGYAGLECSMGACQYDDFSISVAQGTDWRAAPQGEVRPEWVQSLALLSDGRIVYPVRNMHRIQIVTPDGTLVREFGIYGEAPGQLNLPTAVATDKDDHIYVTEAGNNRVQVFDSEGRSLKTLRIAGKASLNQPYAIAVGPDGRVWVGDQGNDRIVCFGETTVAIGGPGAEPGQFNKPMHLTFIGGKLVVADSNNRRLQILDPNNVMAKPEVVPVNDAVKAVAAAGKGGYVISGETIRKLDGNWHEVKTFSGGACDRVWPEYVTYDRSGNLLVADAWESRILTLGPELVEVKPTVSEIGPTSAVVTWTSDLPAPTRLMLLDKPVGSRIGFPTDYAEAKAFGDGRMSTEHRVELSGLEPATRCTFSLASPVRAIPAGANSIDYRFTTKAPDGMMAYTEAPLAVICYSNVTFEGIKKPDGTPQEPVVRDNAWFEQQVRYHEAMRYFYWTNSYMHLDTKCKYLNVTRPVDFAYLGSSSEAVYNDVAELAKREGLTPEDFGAVIVVGGSGYYAYPWPTPWWGGTLTYATGCCFVGGGDTWLSTHEFHHLTEGWMHMIGFPVSGEGGYGFADAPWGHPGPVGENYDFLAHTLRYIPPETYLNLAVGKIKLTADADGDGVPDDDPAVIFDEKRAGTSPKTAESYKNGLTDLQNLTAEIFNPAVKKHKHPLLTKQINLKYPFAVFDYDYERRQKSPTIDGTLDKREWDTFASTPNAVTPLNPDLPWGQAHPSPEGADYRMDTFLDWDDDYLYVAATAPYKFHVSVQLDCNADGYFAGKDNPRFELEVPRDESQAAPNTILPPPGVMVWNNVEPVQQRGIPDWTNDLFDRTSDIKWAWGKTKEGWYVIEVAIPKCPNVGLDLADGEEMGMRLWLQGFLPPDEKSADPRYAFEMFDSCEYGYFTLVK